VAKPPTNPTPSEVASLDSPESERDRAQLTEFERQSIKLFVDAASVLGVPKSIAIIYGILFGSPKPLSFSDIVEKLTISKGSVSQGLRVLREMGAVQVASPTEELEDSRGAVVTQYEPVVELRTLLSGVIADKVQPHLESSGAAIEELSRLQKGFNEPPPVLETRLRHLRAWQKRSRDLLPLLKALLR
jgi:DNA-binding transcriptional regulator GbsR (MarR family)